MEKRMFGRTDLEVSVVGFGGAPIGFQETEHAQANLAAAANGPLPVEAIRELRSAFRDAQEASEKAWAGQT